MTFGRAVRSQRCPASGAGDEEEHVGDTTSDEISRLVAGATVSGAFRDQVRARPDAVALRWKDGEGWGEWTWADYADRACRLAAALTAAGVRRGDRVVLMLRNRPEFHVADVAVLLVGATPISVYNSSSPEQVAYLVGHCGAAYAMVEDDDYLARFRAVADETPTLRGIAVVEPTTASGVSTWGDLLAAAPVDLDAAAAVAQPSDLATVIYTSGTTGPPKGVMLDHENIRWTVECLRRCLADVSTEGRRVVSYLPMAHIAERMTSHYQSIVLGYEITTCPEGGLIGQYLPQVRPEIFFAVPRVWEKMQAGIMAMVGADPARAEQLEAGLAIGLRAADHRARDEALPADVAAAWEQADAGGMGLVRALLGLDACVTAVSGAAPLAVETLDFFRGLGIPISEIYGMSESSGPITWEPFRIRAGMVGRAVPGCEVVLADDGEVLFRGGNVFRGYLDDPAKTAEALDADGWVHTGDIGRIDADGYLRIVDRKKELIITAGGKNLSPANLEAALRAESLIGQACVIGDARPFVSALVVLDPEVAPVWAQQQGIEATSLMELADHPVVSEEVDRQVRHAMSSFNNAEAVKRVTILHEEWLPDSEELTPTMKLKRRGIHAKYSREIEAMYG
jgi:long-chain acyl-CoA synthetase